MRAAIMAAGLGTRLCEDDFPPKVLMRFGGRSLLARHLQGLVHCGLDAVDIAVGYRAEAVAAELRALHSPADTTLRFNGHFDRGSILSLLSLGAALAAGEDVILMDGDVLYDHRMLERLTWAPPGNYFLFDRHLDPGEDPVKICMRGGTIVDFHKRPNEAYDWAGEWIGFARFTPDVAAKVRAAADRHAAAGRLDEIYEEAIRDVLRAEPPGTFQILDVSDLAWVEIDFPEDRQRAREVVFPRLPPLPEWQRGAA